MAVQKTLAPRAWKSRSDFHFYTATAMAANLQFRLHFKCLDDQRQGYILKWLDGEVIWERRTVALKRQGVVRTALRILDEVGLDGLTVRKLASELGVQAPALYWHFKNKQALLDEMATA